MVEKAALMCLDTGALPLFAPILKVLPGFFHTLEADLILPEASLVLLRRWSNPSAFIVSSPAVNDFLLLLPIHLATINLLPVLVVSDSRLRVTEK